MMCLLSIRTTFGWTQWEHDNGDCVVGRRINNSAQDKCLGLSLDRASHLNKSYLWSVK